MGLFGLFGKRKQQTQAVHAPQPEDNEYKRVRRLGTSVPDTNVDLSGTPFGGGPYRSVSVDTVDMETGEVLGEFTYWLADGAVAGECVAAVHDLEALADECVSRKSRPVKMMHLLAREVHGYAGDDDDQAVPRLERMPLTPTGRLPKYPARIRMNNDMDAAPGRRFFFCEMCLLPDGSIGKADIQYTDFKKGVTCSSSFRIHGGRLLPSVVLRSSGESTITLYSAASER